MSESTQTCEQCHASILPEHIAKRRAGRVGGKLLCVACVAEKIREVQASRGDAASASGVISKSGVLAAGRATASAVAANAAPAVVPVSKPVAPVDSIDEPISLVAAEDVTTETSPSTQRAFVKTSLAQADRHETFTRPLVDAAKGATRSRTFHSKLTDAALSYMDNQINEWSDAHPEVHIKFATSTIGMFEAKQHQEPHLIVTVFY